MVVSKFTIGAWIPAIVIPMIVMILLSIRRHYDRVQEAVQIPTGWRAQRKTHNVVVLVGTVNRGVARSHQLRPLARARPSHRGLRRGRPGRAGAGCCRSWAEHNIPVELHTLSSPYRELTRPVIDYLDELDAESPDDIITVVIPEFVTSWSTQFLHNQSAFALKARLLYRPNTVVTSVPVIVD